MKNSLGSVIEEMYERVARALEDNATRDPDVSKKNVYTRLFVAFPVTPASSTSPPPSSSSFTLFTRRLFFTRHAGSL